MTTKKKTEQAPKLARYNQLADLLSEFISAEYPAEPDANGCTWGDEERAVLLNVRRTVRALEQGRDVPAKQLYLEEWEATVPPAEPSKARHPF